MTEPHEKKIAQFYDRTLSVYDLALELFFHPGRKKVADSINCKEGSVLDLGCHSGQLAKLLKSDSCKGIDLSEAAIKKARQIQNPLENNWRFETKSILEALADSGDYQHYCLLYVLSVTPNSDLVLEKIAAKMKPGQRLYLVNHFSSSMLRRKIAALLGQSIYFGFNFYFPLNRDFLSKHYNFIREEKTAFLWTFLELERK